MIEIENLTKVFFPGTVNEKTALSDVSLRVEDAQVVTIIGSNGSGKTTLLNMIAGTFPATCGRIMIDGCDVTEEKEYKRARYIGRIFQDPTKGTSGNMSVEDNMNLASKKGMRGLRNSLTKSKKSAFKEMLGEIGLSERMKDNVSLLSGGQRQALTLLMATLSHPSLLLLDEHTAALDPTNAEIVMNLTQKYIKEQNLTAIMVTHNMAAAIEYGDRLIMMDEGRIILDISGNEKKTLTVPALVGEFKKLRNKEYSNDEGLLI